MGSIRCIVLTLILIMVAFAGVACAQVPGASEARTILWPALSCCCCCPFVIILCIVIVVLGSIASLFYPHRYHGTVVTVSSSGSSRGSYEPQNPSGVNCSKCGAPASVGDEYCRYCGTKLKP